MTQDRNWKSQNWEEKGGKKIQNKKSIPRRVEAVIAAKGGTNSILMLMILERDEQVSTHFWSCSVRQHSSPPFHKNLSVPQATVLYWASENKPQKHLAKLHEFKKERNISKKG